MEDKSPQDRITQLDPPAEPTPEAQRIFDEKQAEIVGEIEAPEKIPRIIPAARTILSALFVGFSLYLYGRMFYLDGFDDGWEKGWSRGRVGAGRYDG